MKSVIQGTAVTSGQAPTLHLGTYRRAIMAVMSADVFTPAERLRANHSVYECEDSAKLVLWLKNVHRVFAEREAVIEQADVTELTEAAQPVRYATAEQTSELHKLALRREITPGERTKALLTLPTLTEPQATALLGTLWQHILHRGGATSAPAPAPRPLPASPPPIALPTPPRPTCPAPFTDSATCQAA